MRSEYHRVNYRPMPAQSRFGFIFGVVHNEACYTAEELQFRNRILSARANSGLDADLLQTSNTWFASNLDHGMVNINQNSWFFNAEYIPKQELSLNDFHIGLIDNQRLHWPDLATMTRRIGDYLLLRNRDLQDSHLNQPMNYVLLDVVQILKRLAMTNSPEYITKQLPLLQSYLRNVEIYTSPTVGSDRLFLTDCRRTIEKQHLNIEKQIHSTQLKTRIYQVRQQLSKVAEGRHNVLHYALVDQAVNPHPYLEHFVSETPQLESKKEFPSLAAKSCATRSDKVTQMDNGKLERLDTMELSSTTLGNNCPDFKFVDNLPEQAKIAYSNSIIELNEILRCQTLLDQLLQLFDQAGEVITVIQFREQMLNLLHSMEQFIHNSQQNILTVVETNANVYHELIQAKQDITWWEKMLTNRQAQIDQFINNQDNLARFDTTPTALQATSKELSQQINEVVNQLTQANEIEQQELISSTRELAQQLMDSMHSWVGDQYIINNLAPPKKLNRLELPKSSLIKDGKKEISSLPIRNNKLPEITPTSASKLAPHFQFWAPVNSCTTHSGVCNPQALINSENAINPNTTDSLNYAALGILLVIPVGALALKMFYDAYHKPTIKPVSNHESFEKTKIATEDLLTVVNGLVQESKDANYKDSLGETITDYEDLLELAQKKQYHTESMQDVQDGLHYLQNQLS